MVYLLHPSLARIGPVRVTRTITRPEVPCRLVMQIALPISICESRALALRESEQVATHEVLHLAEALTHLLQHHIQL
jgi:hypothetical protein